MLDKIYILSIVQKIVDKTFSMDIERKIIQHDNRINLRCPYCHEGNTKSKKRGNLYFDRLIYVCFRCDKKTHIDKLAKDHNILIDPEKKLGLINYLNENITYKQVEDDLSEASLESLHNLSDLHNIFNDGLHILTEFAPISVGSNVHKYLISRGIENSKQRDIFQAKYWHHSSRWEWVMVFLNRRGEKVIGIQVRNIKESKNRFFKIYNYEQLDKWINGENSNLEMEKIIIYNKLSDYFNILNVNFSERITVFEGYLDSLFYPNSIGLTGVNTDIRFLENSGTQLQFFFDNDESGYRKSDQKIRAGYDVFLWRKLFEEIVKRKNSSDPWSLMDRISKIKDLNQLAQLVDNPYLKLELDKFFSKDIFDISWLPKINWKVSKGRIK